MKKPVLESGCGDVHSEDCVACVSPLSLAVGHRCRHCQSKHISHRRIWTRRQVQIFNVLDISRVFATHLCMSQISHIVILTHGSERGFNLNFFSAISKNWQDESLG